MRLKSDNRIRRRPIMKVTVLASVVLGVLVAWTTPLFASCEAAGSAVAQQCGCSGDGDGAPWRNHGQYVSCVQQALSAAGRDHGRGGSCRQDLFRCASKSVCGRAGAVICVRDGKCHVTASADRCTAKGGTVSAAQNCCGV
jgi:hypothetical protein